MRSHIGDLDTACPNLDEKEHLEGLEAHGFDREEITYQLGVLVVIEEGSPGRS